MNDSLVIFEMPLFFWNRKGVDGEVFFLEFVVVGQHVFGDVLEIWLVNFYFLEF